MADQNKPLWAVIEARDASIACLQKALAEIASGVNEKEAVIQTLHKAVECSESQHRLLAKSLEEKEAVIQTQHEAFGKMEDNRLQLTKSLEEKEAVIQTLRPVNRIVLIAHSVTHRLRNILAPRLGNLNQHAPRELRLPAHYARSVHVTQPPKISIVTPSFKQAGFIERTIRSVLDQSYPNLEYYVQDGGSEDGTTEVLERYADRLTGWESRQDNGQAQAINLGFARTSGEIMAWLNSDDILFPGSLAYVADYFNRHPKVDVVYGHRILIDENDQQIGRWMLPTHDDDVLSWADYIPQETLFWRRRIWEKAGGQIDESFRFAMDWDMLVRFREAGARFVRLPHFLGGFRIHPHQKTSAAISEIGHQEMDRIRQRVLGRVPSGMEVRKAVLPYLLKHVVTDLGWRIRNKLGAPS